MKICVFAIPQIKPGKYNVKDRRLDEVDKFVHAKKKTYIQAELVEESLAKEADSILVLKENCSDLILKDLEFVETRLSRSEDVKEKELLNKLKGLLEKEQFVFTAPFSDEEKKTIIVYGLYTGRPVIVAQAEELENMDALLERAVRESGYISFFTAGEKETRAWLIKKGTTAWEAAGAIHSDIQRGFIRAEIISLKDYLENKGETGAKQAGKLRLEQKDYVMQDADLANFRFNK